MIAYSCKRIFSCSCKYRDGVFTLYFDARIYRHMYSCHAVFIFYVNITRSFVRFANNMSLIIIIIFHVFSLLYNSCHVSIPANTIAKIKQRAVRPAVIKLVCAFMQKVSAAVSTPNTLVFSAYVLLLPRIH